MTRIPVAHIREQGQNIIIVPRDRSFEYKTRDEQEEITKGLQFTASSAGLAGKVVPVWDAGGGRMAFIAPVEWHRYFQSLSLTTVARLLNKELICS